MPVSSVQPVTRRGEKGRRRAPASLLAGIVGRIETTPGLDRVGVPFGAGLQGLLRPGPVVDALSGKPLGHPAHPALVSAPIGCWTGALVADLAGERRAGRVLTGLVYQARLQAGALQVRRDEPRSLRVNPVRP